MDNTRGSLSLPKRQLGRYLREAREELGMSLGEAAACIGRSAPTLMRIEKGLTQKLPLGDIEALCRLYRFDAEKTAVMKGLAQQSSTTSWWHEYNDLMAGDFDIYVGLESSAQAITTYQPDLIPGLLQTSDYARVLTRSAVPAASAEEIERRVEVKMRRQLLIIRKAGPAALELIVHEGALRRVVGGGKVMSCQLRYVADVATRPNIEVRVLPFSAGIPSGEPFGAFVMLHFGGDDPSIVYVETLTGELYLEKSASLQRYAGAYEVMQHAAMDSTTSRAMLRQVAKEHLR